MATPKLRFKEFDEKYKSILFKDIEGFSIKSGKSNGRKETGKYSFYGSTGLIGYKDDYDYTGEAILIARVGANAGSLYKVEGKYSVSDNTLMLSASANISLNYIRELLIKFNLNKLVFGTGQPLVTGGLIKKISVSVPKPEEQTKVATFLSAVDTKIDELIQKHELLTDYKKGMMQQIFSQKLRFKADDGSDFEDWDDITLGEISSKSLAKNKDESISEVLTNSATQGVIKQSDYFERDIVTTSNLKGYYVVEIGDFVYNPRISSQAPVGPIKRNKQCLGVMSPLYTVFTTNKGDINYLEYFFESSIWHDYVKSVSNSGARHDRMNIKNQDFFDMPILYPCLAEQTKIANFLTAIDQKIDNVAEQIDHAKTWKKGLLQQMFV